MIAEAVYILCTLTSIAIAVLLIRGYRQTRTRFLLWSALCFVSLAINNALLFVDKVVYPDVDLVIAGINVAIWRGITALIGLSLLLWGLIWDAE